MTSFEQEETELIGEDLDAECDWMGSVLANDNCIYSFPFDDDRILKTRLAAGAGGAGGNCSNSFIECFGNDQQNKKIAEKDKNTSRKWFGCVNGPDGCLYGIPYEAGSILRFDPANQEVSFIGKNLEGYAAAAVCPEDGFIYFFPGDARYILCLNPADGTTMLVGDDLGSQTCKYSGALVGPDRCIYCIPGASAGRVLKWDPRNRTTSFIGSDFNIVGNNGTTERLLEDQELSYDYECFAEVFGADNITMKESSSNDKPKWLGGVLGPDKNIYGIPHNHNKVLKIDIQKQTSMLVGDDLGDDQCKWVHGVLGQDKCIYMMAGCAKNVLKFDTVTCKSRTIGQDLGDGAFKYNGGVLHEDGYIYCIPFFAPKILKIRSWKNWPYMKLRLLHETKRANCLQLEDSDIMTAQQYITDTEDDIFRHVLEFLND